MLICYKNSCAFHIGTPVDVVPHGKPAKELQALDIAIAALDAIMMSPFDVKGFPTAKEAASWMNSKASETLSEIQKIIDAA